MKCICLMCGCEFDANPAWHHSTGLCGEICRKKKRSIIRAIYKKSEKGIAAEMRWRKNPKKKEIDRRSMQKPTAKAKSVIRSRRTLANNPHLQEAKRTCDRRYGKTDRGRQANKEATCRYRKTVRGHVVRSANKASRRGAPGSFTPEEWNEKLTACGNKCMACGSTSEIQIDHIIPISKGGTNNIQNLQPLCKRCNISKGNRENHAAATVATQNAQGDT